MYNAVSCWTKFLRLANFVFHFNPAKISQETHVKISYQESRFLLHFQEKRFPTEEAEHDQT